MTFYNPEGVANPYVQFEYGTQRVFHTPKGIIWDLKTLIQSMQKHKWKINDVLMKNKSSKKIHRDNLISEDIESTS